MAQRPVIAIAGALGRLGESLTRSILQFQQRFEAVVILSRSESPLLKELASLGATPRIYSEENLGTALQGVHVLVNAIGPSGHGFKEKLLRSLPGSSVRLYFPSEFGCYHYIPNFVHPEFDAKKRHFQLAQEILCDTNIHVCRVYAGLFLEDSIGPWFGFNTAEGKYEAVGDLSQRTSYTSIHDIGKAVAVLASSALENSTSMPSEVFLEGDSKSISEIAQIMTSHGAGQINISSIDLGEYKQSVFARPTPTPERYLRYMMAEGKIYHSGRQLENSNSIVNKDNQLWKWKSMVDLAIETHGKPWADFEWTPT